MPHIKEIIPWNKVLGEKGETAVKTRLLNFSNPMKPPIDVGIDFYCELFYPSSQAFYVQAKGTEHFDEKWGRSIDKKTIQLWLNQIHPVYLIVYDDEGKNCYWMSIEENRKELGQRLRTGGKTLYISMDRSHILEDGSNDEFIRKINDDSARLNLIKGTPQFFGEGYVRRIPLVHLSDGLTGNLRERIRISMLYLINNYLLKNDWENAYPLCEFLTRFDKSHYDHFVLFGQLSKALGHKEKARRSFDEAIAICRRDKNWDRLKEPSDLLISEVIATIEKEKESLDCYHSLM